MEMNEIRKATPVDTVNCNFSDYLNRRKTIAADHLNGTIPDYCFSLDIECRKVLDSIPGLYTLGKKIMGTVASNELRRVNMDGLAVGPNQFPDVYEMGRDCARILGIGIPNIYIVPDSSLNAAAYCTDDVEPFIKINSGLYERMTPGELKTVIGHECGHIHNNHAIYQNIAALLFNTGVNIGIQTGQMTQMLLSAISYSGQAALASWSRAAEVSCDRAGIICSDDPRDALTAEAKFLYGAAFGTQEVNLEDLEAQLEMQMNSLAKYTEAIGGINAYGELQFYDHPTTLRRVAAEREFIECELLYKWRPDLLEPGKKLRTLEETNARCKKLIAVFEKGLGEKR